MKKRLLIAAIFALLFTSCTAAKYYRSYVILNSTGSTITNLTISDGNAAEKNWEEALPGQAWIHSSRFRPKPVIVTWSDESGDQEVTFAETKTARQLKADFLIELNPRGTFAARVIEQPPTENGSAQAIFLLVLLYLGYCLEAALIVGVPLGLAALVAYMLFKAGKAGLTTIGQGLRGDHTVFQFSIREIVLLTTVVALGCGWFVVFGINRQEVIAANKRYTDAEGYWTFEAGRLRDIVVKAGRDPVTGELNH